MMAAFDMQQARFNMVEQQIRTWEVLDERVLALLHQMPREEFVPAQYRNLAYSDIEIPLPHGQQMLFPKIEAHLVQALAPKPSDKALVIGTGTGYVTAMLARLANHVYSVDIYPDMLKAAGARLRKLNINNVTLEEGDGSVEWNEHGPYDVIAITGGFPQIPEGYKHKLSVGGRLFVIVGKPPAMKAMIVTRLDEKKWDCVDLFETDIPLLINAQEPPRFVF